MLTGNMQNMLVTYHRIGFRGLDSPTHFEFCWGLDSPTHFEFCGGLDSPTHFQPILSFAGDWILQPILSILMWLGVPSYLSFNVAWSSELVVFRCDLEFRAICISPWLGVPSYFYFTVAWSSELSSSICIFSLHGQKSLHFYCSIIADHFLKQDNWNVLPSTAYP